MQVAVLIQAYNEAEYIGAAIRQWKGLIDKIVVQVPILPWKGSPQKDDGTADIARKEGAEVIIQHWINEKEQRNWGCTRLYDYDYVITLDADEFITLKDRKKLLNVLSLGRPKRDDASFLSSKQKEDCYTTKNIITYWKNDYIIKENSGHKPIIAVDPKKVKFYDCRIPSKVEENKPLNWQPPIDITIHHFSWSRPDNKIEAKIQNFSHADDIPIGWYKNTYLNWSEGKHDVLPYGGKQLFVIKESAPQEIIDLIKN